MEKQQLKLRRKEYMSCCTERCRVRTASLRPARQSSSSELCFQLSQSLAGCVFSWRKNGICAYQTLAFHQSFHISPHWNMTRSSLGCPSDHSGPITESLLWGAVASLGQVHIPLPGGLGHWTDQFTNSYGPGAGLREVENQFL